MAELFSLIDGVWDGIETQLPTTFTTQNFQEILLKDAPEVWAVLVERYGPGGKGTGNFYSPNNILFNYLRDKVDKDELLKVGWSVPEKGWGTRRVQTFQKMHSFEPLADIIISSDEDKSFVEGEPKWVTHLARERAAGLRGALIKMRSAGGLSCDVCGDTGGNLPAEIKEAMFEAHHSTEPLSTGKRETKLSDMALLCACCHRLLHRLVKVRKEWVTVAEAKTYFGPSSD